MLDMRRRTISNIACRTRSGSRRSGIASASRRHTPSLRSDRALLGRHRRGRGGLLKPAFAVFSRPDLIKIAPSIKCGSRDGHSCLRPLTAASLYKTAHSDRVTLRPTEVWTLGNGLAGQARCSTASGQFGFCVGFPTGTRKAATLRGDGRLGIGEPKKELNVVTKTLSARAIRARCEEKLSCRSR